MNSFIFAVSAVAPIVLMVVVGYMLKKIGWMNESFSKMANKLVFRIFMPVMLFVKIYAISDLSNLNYWFLGYTAIAILVIFAIAVPASFFITKQKNRRGVLVQAAFRSSYSLIGIPVADSLYGEKGAIAATLLSVVAIPIFNVLAVISLSALDNSKSKKVNVGKIILDILKNPLILGIAAGVIAIAVRMLLQRNGINFRLSDIGPLFKVLNYLSDLAIPLALLVLGAQFEFSAVASMKKEIIWGTVIRTVLVPALVVGVAYFFLRDKFAPEHFATFVSVFATPVAVPSVPMVQEMDGDVTLAGQLVVWSTLVSAFTVFLITLLLRLGGAF